MHGFDPMRQQCDMHTLAFRIEVFFGSGNSIDRHTGREIQRYNMRIYKRTDCASITRIRWGSFMANEDPLVLIDRDVSIGEESDMLLICNNAIEKKATLKG